MERRPSDPIEFLARYLYKAADCDLYFQEKAVFETEKRLLGVKLKKEGQQRQNAMARYKKQISELQQFLRAFSRKGTSPGRLPVKQTARHRKHFRSVSIGGKEERRRTKISFLENVGFRQTFDYSSTADTSSETEASSPESPTMFIGAAASRVLRRSILRKASMPPSERKPKPVVSVHKDSVTSSRTPEDEVLERSPSTLTSSSRTTSKRLSVSYGDEGEVKESWDQLQEAEIKPKRKSRVRLPAKTAETDDVEDMQQKSRRSIDERSLTDESVSTAGVESVSQIIGRLERVESLKEQSAKKKRKRKIKIEAKEDLTAADVSSASESGMSLIEPTDEQKYTLAVSRVDMLERVSRGEIAEEIILEDIREELLERQSSLDIAVGVKEKPKGRKASMKRAALDQKRSRKSDLRVDSSEPSRKKDSEPSREASLEPSVETSPEEDVEFEADYGPYVTADTDSLYETQLEEGTDQDFTDRSIKPKQKKLPKAKKKPSTAATDIEDARRDQKGRGKRGISKREMKLLDDEEEEQIQTRISQMEMRTSLTPVVSEILTNEPEEDEQQKQIVEVKPKRKKKVEKRKQPLLPKETPEDDEGAAEDEQYEDNLASRKVSRRESDITDTLEDTDTKDSRQADSETKKRRRRKRRKSAGKAFDDEDQEEPTGTSQTQISSARRSTETSADDFVRDRASVAKTGARRGRTSTASARGRSFPKTLRSKSRAESERMLSEQFSEILLSEYPEDAETAPDTSVRPSEIEQIAAESTEEPYSFPFTPVECEWLLIDSHTLVCRHPILGDIRSRPTTISNALDFTGWTDRRNYNWRAFYDHEVYTVKDPFQDDTKFKRRLKGP